MGTGEAGPSDSTAGGVPALHLVPAAAALRWVRPELTVTLAELALESATDAATWIAAAGWLLHGRAALGDGRETACDLLDGLGRWGATGEVLMTGPVGRRLRVELAGPARRIGEPGVARAMLSADAGLDDGDAGLRADVLTELARCAVDDAPDTADDALRAADRAWRDAACPPGTASVMLLAAARQRRAGNADVAVTQAADGLRSVNAGGRRAGATASDHVAAALTAEWIAALTEAGRVGEARAEALPLANRLITTARTSRQVAGLRLAVARVTAVEESPEAVFTALEAAAEDAADSDVPELEAACRTMLGGLHESAGRLDAALGALRAAMAAERRDRDRGARLRARLAAVATTWAATPSHARAVGRSNGVAGRLLGQHDEAPPVVASPWDISRRPAGTSAHGAAAGDGALRDGAGHGDGPGYGGAGATTGRRARRPTETTSAGPVGRTGPGDDRDPRDGRDAGDRFGAAARPTGGTDGPPRHRTDAAPRSGEARHHGDVRPVDPSATSRLLGSPEHPDTASSGRWTGASGGSLIGDELLRELAASAASPRAGGNADDGNRNGDAGYRDEGNRDDPADGDTVVLGVAVEPPPGRTRDAAPDADADRTATDAAVAADPAPDGPPSRTPDGDGTSRDGRVSPLGRRGSSRSPGARPPSTDPDGLGLADLLAGALAAYRDL